MPQTTTETHPGPEHEAPMPHKEVYDTMLDMLDSPEVNERFARLAKQLAELGMKQIIIEEFGPRANEEVKSKAPLSPDEQLWEEQFAHLVAVNDVIILLLLDQLYSDYDAKHAEYDWSWSQPPKAEQRSKKSPTFESYDSWYKNSRPGARYDFNFGGSARATRPTRTTGTTTYTGGPQPQPAAKPDFRPAPSMGDVAEGPKLPPIPFNDRIRPGAAMASPSPADLAAANRANEMYQSALWKSGWRGGDITPQQEKSAGREMAKQGMAFDAPKADSEAFKMFNATNAARGKQGTGPVNTDRERSTSPPPAPEAAPPPPPTSEAAPASAQPASAPASPESGPSNPGA